MTNAQVWRLREFAHFAAIVPLAKINKLFISSVINIRIDKRAANPAPGGELRRLQQKSHIFVIEAG